MQNKQSIVVLFQIAFLSTTNQAPNYRLLDLHRSKNGSFLFTCKSAFSLIKQTFTQFRLKHLV